MSNEHIETEKIIETVAAALARAEPLSFAECNQLTSELIPALEEIGERLSRTAPADDRRPAGAERLQALKTGSVDDVRRIDAEYETVKILASQLTAQRDALANLRGIARLREAMEGMPMLHQQVVGRVAEAEAAKESLQRALAAVWDATMAVHAARGALRVGNLQPEGGATVGTLQRLQKLDSAFFMDNPRNRGNRWLDHLGCAVSEHVLKEAWAKTTDVDFSDCTSDAEIMSKAVAAEKGPSAVEGKNDQEVANAFGCLVKARPEAA